MKNTKRIFAGLLATIIFVMTMSFSAFAADDGSIIINDSEGGERVASRTFNIYKIFNATTSGTAISYQWYIPDGESESPYFDFFYSDWDSDGTTLLNPDAGTSQERAAQHMRSLSVDDLIVLSSKIYAYIESKSIQPTATKVAGATDVQVNFSGLEYGYYLIYDATVDPEVRSAVILTSVAPNSTVKLKAEKPAISKVYNGSKKVGSAMIGDELVYTITTVVPDHSHFTDEAAYVYTVEDEVPAKLILDAGSITVTREGVALTPDVDYKLTVVGQKITVEYLKLLDYTDGDQLVIAYNAVLGDDVTAAECYENEAKLTYSNDPTDATSTGETTSIADVHTYYLDLTKVSSANHTVTLAGAKFKLLKDVAGVDTELNFVQVTDGHYKVQAVTGGATANNLEMQVAANGVLRIEGLDAGNYVLVETVAPDGYKLPLDPFEFTIVEEFTTDGSNTLDGLTVSNINTSNLFGAMVEPSGDIYNHVARAKITNEAGTALPETGGMGTTLFTVMGVVMMAVALGFFGVRRKNNAEA